MLTLVTVPLTGPQFELNASRYTATITALGAGLRTLAHDGTPLVHCYQADELPPAAAGELLAPWPNRIDQGRYTFDGTDLQLALTEPARSTAIHGLTRWAMWSVTAQDRAAVTLRCAPHGVQGYPFSVGYEVTYRLSEGDGLTVTLTARNEGSRRAPYGNGFHPYLTAGTEFIDECELTLPAEEWLPLDDRGLPAGKPEPVDGTTADFRAARLIGDTVLDSALTGLQFGTDERAWAHLAGRGRRVSLWAGAGYRWLQVFTADPLPAARRRKAIAIEPMTCPPNAFATGEDLLVLDPGAEVTHSWGILAQ